MKKLWICAMAVALLLSMAACGNEDADADGRGDDQQTQENTQDNVQDDAQDGTQQGGEGESQPDADDSQQTQGDSLKYLRDAVVEVLGDNYWPNTEITPERLEEVYGIKPDMYDAYFGETPMISVNVDTLIIIRAKEGQVDAVEEALNAYRDVQVSDTMQYPMNVGKIQASRIEVLGNYVCFVQLGADTEAAMEEGDEAVIDQCLQENERAIDAIEKAISE
ncbi:MAG: DUF4358 domain-containing protein [Lachnospiraceae bacterium]|nr:DUF4358 domain-containing protein [Lachnospiraceae bacterium]